MSHLLVKDPWPDRARAWYWREIHCPTFGHQPQQKMYCVICRRCRVVIG